jgi:hypothetical protein
MYWGVYLDCTIVLKNKTIVKMRITTDSYDSMCIVMESYKDVQISIICKSSYPCSHYVILPDGIGKTMSGHDIYKIIPRRHPAYNHFKTYKYWKCKVTVNNILALIDDFVDKCKEAKWEKDRQREEAASNYNKPLHQPVFKLST